MKTSKTITSLELYELILKKNNEFSIDNVNNFELTLDNYTIEGEHIILDDKFKIHIKLNFYRCFFKSKFGLYIEGVEFHEKVIIDSCSFSGGININRCVFDNDFYLLNIKTSNLYISGHNKFNKISITGNNQIKKINIFNFDFNNVHIGDFSINNVIEELSIFTSNGKSGNIIVQNQSFKMISILGTNDNKEFVFENIKCDVFNIDQFRNEGNLVFYGIEPLNPKNEESFFQIINSNLKNAQFHNVQFNKYKELVILDSFIQNCIFIGCKWSNNIRALFGKGYYHYEDSLLNGRAISEIEITRIKDAYRQLKISMSNQSDKIQERKFYAEELNYHNRSLKWSLPWKNQFWDKLILYFSKYLSDYGQSFIIPLFWLLFGHFILFNTAVLCNSIESLQFSFVECSYDGFKLAFEKYFIYLNPLRSSETTLNGYSIILDLLMRIWSSYMLYNIIRASRRFLS